MLSEAITSLGLLIFLVVGVVRLKEIQSLRGYQGSRFDDIRAEIEENADSNSMIDVLNEDGGRERSEGSKVKSQTLLFLQFIYLILLLFLIFCDALFTSINLSITMNQIQ